MQDGTHAASWLTMVVQQARMDENRLDPPGRAHCVGSAAWVHLAIMTGGIISPRGTFAVWVRAALVTRVFVRMSRCVFHI